MKAELTPATESGSRLSSLCEAITEHSPLPMAAVAGRNHIVDYANPSFCRLMDRPKEELVGRTLDEMLPGMDECLASIDRVFRTGKPESHTGQDRSNPQPSLWNYRMWPVMEGERPVGVMVQVTETSQFHETMLAMNEALTLALVRQDELSEASDILNAQLRAEIIERKHVEEALHRAQAELADRAGQLEHVVAERTTELTATNKQLEVFVYSIAHDLRAPLRAMQGFSWLLVEGAETALSETHRDFANRINQSAQFMDALLQDLLAFSYLAQEQIELTLLNLEPVVRTVLSRLENEIREKNGRVEIAGPWPTVASHEPTLGQVLTNLVSNALKFVRPDAPPRIRLHAEERGRFVRVWVEDNGIGIAPHHQAQVFGLFTRLHGERYAGTGLGLAIVQKSVERMKGSVGLESTPGHGSRFWFELRKPE